VRKQQSFIFRISVGFIAVVAFFWLTGASLWGQTGAVLDKGGAVFNVKAYGASGNGTTDDTASIQHAVDAALSAGGGIVYLPAGKYLLKGTVTISRIDLVSLEGVGMGTNLQVGSNLGISLGATSLLLGGSHGYHSGRIEGMHITCSNQSKAIAVQMTDMIADPQLNDLMVTRCDQAFDIVNEKYWNERLIATNVTDDNNNHLFHLDQNPKNHWDSFGYAIYDGIFVNKGAGQDVIYMTGGGNLYNSKLVIKGNFDGNATDASIFNLEGKPGEPCPGASDNAVDVAVEGDSYSVLRSNGNGCKGGLWGSAFFRGTGLVVAMGKPVRGGGIDSITNASGGSILAATFTASTATTDTVGARGVIPNTPCFVQATNATAAGAMTGTYVSSTDWRKVIVAHPAKAAGGTFQVWCAAQ